MTFIMYCRGKCLGKIWFMKTAYAVLFHQNCIGEIWCMKRVLAKCENCIQEETTWMKLYSWQLQGKTCMAKTALVKYAIHKNYIIMRNEIMRFNDTPRVKWHYCFKLHIKASDIQHVSLIFITFVCIVIRNTSTITYNHKTVDHQFVMKIEGVQLR
jgi:hypothetical protein